MDAKCKSRGEVEKSLSPFVLVLTFFSRHVIPEVVHSTLPNSPANHLRPPLLSAGWSANDPMVCRSIGKSEYAKRVLMFGIAQPLALSSRPFDVALICMA